MLEKIRETVVIGFAVSLPFATFAQSIPGSAVAATGQEQSSRLPAELPSTTAPLLWQRSMNVFRRFATDPGKIFEFYGEVLGFEQLNTINFGSDSAGAGVARFQAGAQEFKLTRRVSGKQYQPGGVDNATGLRLLTFYFADEDALDRRFAEHGYSRPQFQDVPGTKRRSALVADPDGQAVELVVVPRASPAVLERIDVGLTVSDLDRSLAFYRSFVGLEELPPVDDWRFGTKKYSFRHGATTVTLRSFGPLPRDDGSGGIQYVVTNVDVVDALAKVRHIPVDQPLRSVPNFSLRTLWLKDPDGITNYFAETAQSRRARTAGVTR